VLYVKWHLSVQAFTIVSPVRLRSSMVLHDRSVHFRKLSIKLYNGRQVKSRSMCLCGHKTVATVMLDGNDRSRHAKGTLQLHVRSNACILRQSRPSAHKSAHMSQVLYACTTAYEYTYVLLSHIRNMEVSQ
jgi:hypothetical protein